MKIGQKHLKQPNHSTANEEHFFQTHTLKLVALYMMIFLVNNRLLT